MLTAVDFDNQHRLKANEVGDIMIEGDLTSELEFLETFRSQDLP